MTNYNVPQKHIKRGDPYPDIVFHYDFLSQIYVFEENIYFTQFFYVPILVNVRYG